MVDEHKNAKAHETSKPDGKSADKTSALPNADEESAGVCGDADGTSALRNAVGWTYRGYLPHFDDQDTPQFITFRLADSIPAHVIEGWKQELGLDKSPENPENTKRSQENRKLRERVEKYLDCGYGQCLLKHAGNADLVAKALQHFDGVRYQLHAWVIMPNHVHVLCQQKPGWPLSTIVRNWKSFTAHAINKSMDRSGTLWQADYFDRYIRNETHFLTVAQYIERNPVIAGLCLNAADWLWSSISRSADVPSASAEPDMKSHKP